METDEQDNVRTQICLEDGFLLDVKERLLVVGLAFISAFLPWIGIKEFNITVNYSLISLLAVDNLGLQVGSFLFLAGLVLIALSEFKYLLFGTISMIIGMVMSLGTLGLVDHIPFTFQLGSIVGAILMVILIVDTIGYMFSDEFLDRTNE